MSLELFLDSKIIMSMTKKTHFWPLKEMRRLGLLTTLGEMMAKTKTEQKRKTPRVLSIHL
jgi:hypothetical protein